MWEYRGDGSLRLMGSPYVWFLYVRNIWVTLNVIVNEVVVFLRQASKVGIRLYSHASPVVGECSVSRADQFSWFVRYVRPAQ